MRCFYLLRTVRRQAMNRRWPLNIIATQHALVFLTLSNLSAGRTTSPTTLLASLDALSLLTDHWDWLVLRMLVRSLRAATRETQLFQTGFQPLCFVAESCCCKIWYCRVSKLLFLSLCAKCWSDPKFRFVEKSGYTHNVFSRSYLTKLSSK